MIRRVSGAGAIPLAALLILSAAGCGGGHPMSAGPDVVTGPSAGGGAPSSGGVLADVTARADADESNAGARPIDSPGTIAEPGDYQLTRDLTVTDGDGLVVQASGVRLRLGGHTLTGPGNKAGRAIVIDGAHDVLVSGGRIRRFGLGVAVLGAHGCRVRDVVIEGGDETADPANGNPPQIGVMLVNSDENVIAGNRLRDVNLGLFVRGGESRDNLLHHNVVLGGQHGLLGVCYNPAPSGGPAGPRGDRVLENLLSRFGVGLSASAGSEANRFAGNTIRYFDVAWVDQNGANVFRHNRAVQIPR